MSHGEDMLSFIGNDMHYQEAFLIDLIAICLRSSIYLGVILLNLNIGFWFFQKKIQKNTNIGIKGKNAQQEVPHSQQSFIKYIQGGMLVLWTMIMLCLGSIFAILGGFKKLSFFSSVVLTFLFFTLPSMYLSNKYKQLKIKRKSQYIYTILQIAVSLFICYSLQDICVCLFNEDFGHSIFSEEYLISSKLTRQFQITSTKICKDDQICHIYATLAAKTHDRFILNIQSGTNIFEVEAKIFEKQNEGLQLYREFKIDGAKYIEDLEYKGQRHMFSKYVKNLQSDTLYHIQIYHQGKLVKFMNYRTLPKIQTELRKIKLIVGGDVGITPPSKKIIQQLNQFDPDIIIIGGDVSYDDGLRSCYYSWDTWLDMWNKHLFQKLNRTVPFILAFGNHDIGYNSFNNITMDLNNDKEVPLIYEYFPQNFNDEEIPPLNQRLTFFHNVIGNLVFLTLDSGYIATPEQQKPYIKYIGEKYKNYVKFAQYHVPTYPTCFDTSDIWGRDQQTMDSQEKNFIPLFDEYKYMTVFENHGHMFKRTFPLKNGTINMEYGVTYLGDGSLGIHPPYECPQEYYMNETNGFMANFKHKDSHHAWVVTLDVDYYSFDAIRPDNQFYDKDHRIYLDNYR